ncbi:MAG: hypothetical protein ACP5SH_11650, partial [Syntrophobacteraceae bacterium]
FANRTSREKPDYAIFNQIVVQKPENFDPDRYDAGRTYSSANSITGGSSSQKPDGDSAIKPHKSLREAPPSSTGQGTTRLADSENRPLEILDRRRKSSPLYGNPEQPPSTSTIETVLTWQLQPNKSRKGSLPAVN